MSGASGDGFLCLEKNPRNPPFFFMILGALTACLTCDEKIVKINIPLI